MDRITFKINGVPHSVGCEVSSDVKLVDYLRDELECRGTKYMCREAGCGACIVSAVTCSGGPVLAVNACMVSITSCQDWEITTIEGLGNRSKGYHVLQQTLAEYNGTQCGYCSPAWVMGMYSLLQNRNKPTMLEIETSFGSNVCRCTGYRPILDAFKTFAKDAPKNKLIDIEDLAICKKTGVPCKKTSCDEDDWCLLGFEDSRTIEIRLRDNKCWYKVSSIRAIFEILNVKGYDSYMFVFGNTARGAYPIDEYPNILIDISTVRELKMIQLDQNLCIGAGLTLTELLNILKTASETEYFGYLHVLYKHIQLVAHIPVRNIGSIGGNLMIKHQHNDFPSDLFLLFETVGACLQIVNSRGFPAKLTMQQFLKEDMKGKVIVSVLFPPLSDEYKMYSYKVMPRSQNAHAIVNGGFLFKLSNTMVVDARIVYGGLSPSFIRAGATERFLKGKQLFKNETLQSALKILKSEAVVTPNPPEPSVEYRRHLALVLFYKALLHLCPKEEVNKRYMFAQNRIHDTRPVSQGRQIFDTDPSLWPLNQPIPKIDGLIQCAGEAKYSEDLPTQPREVHAAFALSTVALGDIVSIDASRALKVPGVIAFYKASDIPGLNSFTPAGVIPFYTSNEEVLCSGTVVYFNQPIGIIVAETQYTADNAAKLVTATYKNINTPQIDIKETKKDPNRLTLNFSSDSTDVGKDVTKVIKGEQTIYGQYHFTMENLSCVTRPTEEGLEVFTTSQWLDGVQLMISRALKIDENRVDVHLRRVGGGFGMKISRNIQVAVACSLVAQKLNRPCRLVMPLTTTTRAVGKRLPCHSDFECGVSSSGVIQHMNYNLYEDNGYKVNEPLAFLGNGVFNNGYDKSRWNYKCYDATTDNAKNTWCRSPGSLECIASAEQIMERISYELALDPIDVRLANLDTKKYKDLEEMIETLKSTADYTTRKASVTRFNAENRWRKRGLRISTVKWTTVGAGIFDVNLSVFHGDGTVIITHGAVEMGQGVNTKITQIVAYILKIPISKIQVKPHSTIISPNGFITGGSIGSQNAGIGARKCAEELMERLKPIRSQNPQAPWEELIVKSFEGGVDLQVHSYFSPSEEIDYDIFGVSFAEVEVDVLTGEFEVLRVDVLQDVGQSISPEIDVGQVEGAFIMGLGYWTSEELVYNDKTGELLTDRTWNYYVPQAKDIPQDFRINFRKKSYSFKPLLGAKATGEPPICLSIVVAFALREAVAEARRESGLPITEWFTIDGPYTVEKLALAASSKVEDFKFN